MSVAGTLAMMIPIVAITGGIGSGMFHHWLKLKREELDKISHRTAESAAQYAAKTERLEQRVAVLERLLTDRSTHLADEIERLRHDPLN